MTIAQAKAFAEIRKMKHAITPRVPQLHNRTLSGNIFDQSLGVLHASGVTPELFDTEHAHLEIIGKEVSIWQEDPESADLQSSSVDKQRHLSGGSDSGMGSGDVRTGEAAVVSPEKFADDTPGIGMEVVCEEGVETGISMNDIESSLHNGVINGLKAPPTLFNHLHQRSTGAGLGDMSSTEDSDGEIHIKILRIFQDARYDLRFPVQRYSNQASRSQKSKTPPASSSTKQHVLPVPASAPAKKRGRPRKSQTPSQCVSAEKPPNRKRGRPRKNPLPTL